jgi:hypothetical protein
MARDAEVEVEREPAQPLRLLRHHVSDGAQGRGRAHTPVSATAMSSATSSIAASRDGLDALRDQQSRDTAAREQQREPDDQHPAPAPDV